MASNSSGDDWIELYNGSASPVDLGGKYLTDNLDIPTKYVIAMGVTIQAGEHKVFWADNNPENGPVHTNFELNAGGEEIGLFDADGVTPIDIIDYDELSQVTDISYGRYPDASDQWRYLSSPTPGTENDGAYLGTVADTTFDHERSIMSTAFTKPPSN